jgi:sugar phosphate isomerase/epimerase
MIQTKTSDAGNRIACTTATFGGLLPAKLQAMKDAGFVATEFWPRDLYEDPRGPDYSIGLLRDSGLSVCAYQAFRDFEGSPEPYRKHAYKIAEQMMDQMAWIGADLLILCTNMREDASGERSRIVDDLGELAELGRSRNIRIAYEHVCWGRKTSDYRDVWSLVKEVDHSHLGIMLDSLHIFCKDLPLDGIGVIDPAKLFLVEVADIPKTNLPYMEVGRHYRLFPGEGVAPVNEFLRRVKGIGYDGLYSVEIMNARYLRDEPAAVAKHAAATLREALASA